jgi:hypothetical protein
MRTCFRKLNEDRNIPHGAASISRKYDAAQRLFNGGHENEETRLTERWQQFYLAYIEAGFLNPTI